MLRNNVEFHSLFYFNKGTKQSVLQYLIQQIYIFLIILISNENKWSIINYWSDTNLVYSFIFVFSNFSFIL